MLSPNLFCLGLLQFSINSQWDRAHVSRCNSGPILPSPIKYLLPFWGSLMAKSSVLQSHSGCSGCGAAPWSCRKQLGHLYVRMCVKKKKKKHPKGTQLVWFAGFLLHSPVMLVFSELYPQCLGHCLSQSRCPRNALWNKGLAEGMWTEVWRH